MYFAATIAIHHSGGGVALSCFILSPRTPGGNCRIKFCGHSCIFFFLSKKLSFPFCHWVKNKGAIVSSDLKWFRYLTLLWPTNTDFSETETGIERQKETKRGTERGFKEGIENFLVVIENLANTWTPTQATPRGMFTYSIRFQLSSQRTPILGLVLSVTRGWDSPKGHQIVCGLGTQYADVPVLCSQRCSLFDTERWFDRPQKTINTSLVPQQKLVDGVRARRAETVKYNRERERERERDGERAKERKQESVHLSRKGVQGTAVCSFKLCWVFLEPTQSFRSYCRTVHSHEKRKQLHFSHDFILEFRIYVNLFNVSRRTSRNVTHPTIMSTKAITDADFLELRVTVAVPVPFGSLVDSSLLFFEWCDQSPLQQSWRLSFDRQQGVEHCYLLIS